MLVGLSEPDAEQALMFGAGYVLLGLWRITRREMVS
jgi:hypothetical protein